MKKLKLLYLHNNLFEDVEDFEKIYNVNSLLYLTIFSNPVSSKPGIRHFIVNKMSHLFCLDFNIISDEERTENLVSTSKY